MIQKIDKPWGYEEILEQNDNYIVKRLCMYQGHRCSLQYHEHKKETIYVLHGELTVWYGTEGFKENYDILSLPEGSTITIDPAIKHRMEAKKGTVLYLECSTNHLNDVIRLADDYQRSYHG